MLKSSIDMLYKEYIEYNYFVVVQVKATSRRAFPSPHRRVPVLLLQLFEDVHDRLGPEAALPPAWHLQAGGHSWRF